MKILDWLTGKSALKDEIERLKKENHSLIEQNFIHRLKTDGQDIEFLQLQEIGVLIEGLSNIYEKEMKMPVNGRFFSNVGYVIMRFAKMPQKGYYVTVKSQMEHFGHFFSFGGSDETLKKIENLNCLQLIHLVSIMMFSGGDDTLDWYLQKTLKTYPIGEIPIKEKIKQ